MAPAWAWIETKKKDGGWRELPAAIFYDGPDTLYLFVDLILQLSRRAQCQLLTCPKVLLLRSSHLRDQVKKFPTIHSFCCILRQSFWYSFAFARRYFSVVLSPFWCSL